MWNILWYKGWGGIFINFQRDKIHKINCRMGSMCHLLLNPIILGGGKRALPDNLRMRLELLGERRFRSGVVHLHYRVTVWPALWCSHNKLSLGRFIGRHGKPHPPVKDINAARPWRVYSSAHQLLNSEHSQFLDFLKPLIQVIPFGAQLVKDGRFAFRLTISIEITEAGSYDRLPFLT